MPKILPAPRTALLDSSWQRPQPLDARQRSNRLIWLDRNENLDPELQALCQTILAGLPPAALTAYPDPAGAYAKLADHLGISARGLLLTQGCDGAIRQAFQTFVEPGDTVIFPAPSYVMYRHYSAICGARGLAIDYQRGPAGPQLPLDRLISALETQRPKLLCLPNPDSPTGAVLPPESIRDLLRRCERTGTLLLLDEAYHPFHSWSGLPWTATSRHLLVARSFSKAWGCAGLRLGCAVAHPDTMAWLYKQRAMHEVGTLALQFVERLVDHADAMHGAVARQLAAKARFEAAMGQLGFRCLSSHASFVLVAFGAQSALIEPALRERVGYRPSFEHPVLAGFSRFSLAPMPVMDQVADWIAAAHSAASQ